MKPPDANESIWPCTKSMDSSISSCLGNEYGVYTSTKMIILILQHGIYCHTSMKTVTSFNKIFFLHHSTLLSISMPRYPLMQYMINVCCIYMWLMPSPVAFTVVSYVMFCVLHVLRCILHYSCYGSWHMAVCIWSFSLLSPPFVSFWMMPCGSG